MPLTWIRYKFYHLRYTLQKAVKVERKKPDKQHRHSNAPSLFKDCFPNAVLRALHTVITDSSHSPAPTGVLLQACVRACVAFNVWGRRGVEYFTKNTASAEVLLPLIIFPHSLHEPDFLSMLTSASASVGAHGRTTAQHSCPRHDPSAHTLDTLLTCSRSSARWAVKMGSFTFYFF